MMLKEPFRWNAEDESLIVVGHRRRGGEDGGMHNSLVIFSYNREQSYGSVFEGGFGQGTWCMFVLRLVIL